MDFLNNEIQVLLKPFGELVQTETIIVDEYVQRKLSSPRKRDIAKYIHAALGDKSRGAYFAPIVCSRRESGLLAILDGQHRYYGYLEAIEALEKDVQKLKQAIFTRGDTADRARRELGVESEQDLSALERRFRKEDIALKTLYQSVFPVIVYEGLTTPQEQQLFHDLNNLGKSASPSVSMYFNHTDPYAGVAREILRQEWMADYISVDKLSGNSMFLFSTVVRGVERFIGKVVEDTIPKNLRADTIALFQTVVESLPDDVLVRMDAYMYRDAKVLQGICGFARQMREEHKNWLGIVTRTLQNVPFSKTNLDFVTIGGALKNESGQVVFNATGSGITAIMNTLRAHSESVLSEPEIATTVSVHSGASADYAGDYPEERKRILEWLKANNRCVSASLKKDYAIMSGSTRERTRCAMLELAEEGVVTVETFPGKPHVYKLNI